MSYSATIHRKEVFMARRKMVRTKGELNALRWEIQKVDKPYKSAMAKQEALQILRDQSGEITECEMAEIAANGGAVLDDGSLLYAY